MATKTMPVLTTNRLTDEERIALSYAFFDMQFDIHTYKDMAGIGSTISGWKDITDRYEAARLARIHTSMASLQRFGLAESYYEHPSPSRERILEKKGRIMKVREAGWRYNITAEGVRWLHLCNARIYKCCDGCVVLNCVCLERTFCAEHGGGCNGSHE